MQLILVRKNTQNTGRAECKRWEGGFITIIKSPFDDIQRSIDVS